MRVRILPVVLGVLLIIGAGCAATKPPVTDTKDANNTDVKGTTDTTGDTKNEGTSITLTGENTGPNSVKLEWDPSDEIVTAAQKWMVIVGDTENPEYPKNNRFWYQRDKSYREKEWKNLPKGKLHFRVCAWVDNACTTYSNDLSIDIPGHTPGTK